MVVAPLLGQVVEDEYQTVVSSPRTRVWKLDDRLDTPFVYRPGVNVPVESSNA